MTNSIRPRIPLEYQQFEISPVLEFELQNQILSLNYDEDTLITGTPLGVSILSPVYAQSDQIDTVTPLIAFQNSFIHLGFPSLHVCSKNGFLAAAHPDFSISLVNRNAKSKITTLEGSRGHDSFINSLDIDVNGIVASTGDDRSLIIWEDGVPKSFILSNSGKIVKFWDSINSDRLVVLESGNKISVLDWRKGEWLVTIYVGGGNGISEVKDIGVYEGDIIAVGNGWWKSYNIQSLTGGCGYTAPTDEGRLLGSGEAVLIKLNENENNTTPKVSYVANNIGFYDIASVNEHPKSIDYNMGVKKYGSISFNSIGNSIATSSGRILSICRS